MNRFLRKSVLIIFFLILTTVVCSGMHEQFRPVIERGELRLGIFDENNYPLVYNESGTWKGHEINIARTIADQLGVRLRIITLKKDPQTVNSALNSGRVDIVFSKIIPTLRDAEQVYFTKTTAVVDMVLIFHRINYARKRLPMDPSRALRTGKINIAHVDRQEHTQFLQKHFRNISTTKADSEEELIQSLKDGEVTAILLDEVSAEKLFMDNPKASIHYRYVSLNKRQPVVGLVSWRNDFLLEWIDIAIFSFGKPKTIPALIQAEKTGVLP